MKKIYWLALIPLAAVAAITPNMLLNKPVSGDTNYATKFNTILDQIDSHDHTSGKGVQIPTDGIEDGAITIDKMATQSVGTAQIVNESITTDMLIDGAVTTAKLDNGAVTSGKLADDSISSAKMKVASVGDAASIPNTIITTGVSTSSADDYVYDETAPNNFTASGSYVDTGLSLVMSARGKIIQLGLQSKPSATGYLSASAASGLVESRLRILKSGTQLYETSCVGTVIAGCPLALKIDDPTPGGSDTNITSVTYNVQMESVGAGVTTAIVNPRFTGTMKR